MKAVNLIPKDARRGRVRTGGLGFSPSYGVLGLLVVALALVVIYVLTSNTISDRKAKLADVQAQVSAQQAVAARLSKYVQFEQLAQTRVQTVRELAAARFDWYRAMTDVSKVVPANTSLQSLTGTVAPGASAAGTGGGGAASGLRSDETVPAFELIGCTKTQDDVARLMSRLRLINGVTRVTLGSTQKEGSGGTGATTTAGTGGSGGCGANGPAFDLVVFFSPLAGAGPTGVTSVSATPAGTSTPSTPPSTTTPTTTSTTGTATTPATPSATTTGAGQ